MTAETIIKNSTSMPSSPGLKAFLSYSSLLQRHWLRANLERGELAQHTEPLLPRHPRPHHITVCHFSSLWLESLGSCHFSFLPLCVCSGPTSPEPACKLAAKGLDLACGNGTFIPEVLCWFTVMCSATRHAPGGSVPPQPSTLGSPLHSFLSSWKVSTGPHPHPFNTWP